MLQDHESKAHLTYEENGHTPTVFTDAKSNIDRNIPRLDDRIAGFWSVFDSFLTFQFLAHHVGALAGRRSINRLSDAFALRLIYLLYCRGRPLR